ncbi:MAG: glycosyltransferase family 2 protein [Spirochaetales bacterium]|nr:glycosyltransferase family 2 protein [Spirochaetales bacterium]
MNPAEVVFTILTPTYNRAHTLPRVYQSICAQEKVETERALFEWLVIDDGSTDTTGELIDRYQKEAAFPIRYSYGPNKGKSLALNKGYDLARGEFCVIADSDDAMAPGSLRIFFESWFSLPPEKQITCAGISCCSMDGYSGKRMGREPPGAPLLTETDFLTYCYKNRWFVEGWSAVKTGVFREFPFPEIKGPDQFVPEAYSWVQLGRKYPFLVLPDTLRIIFFQPDGYTLNPKANLRKQARGRFLYYSANINWNRDLMLRYWPSRYLRDLLQAARTAAFAGFPSGSALQSFRARIDRLLVLPIILFSKLYLILESVLTLKKAEPVKS